MAKHWSGISSYQTAGGQVEGLVRKFPSICMVRNALGSLGPRPFNNRVPLANHLYLTLLIVVYEITKYMFPVIYIF